MDSVKLRPNYHRVEGVLVPGKFKPECVREAINYKPKSDDVFIVTYPKCGTTWMQNIVVYIYRKGQEVGDPQILHTMCPFIDPMGLGGIENMLQPGALKTHLPFTHVPYSPEAKYIYVLRNPKDCCVSMYYHTRRAQSENYGNATFDEFYEIFMDGEVEYNDYFDHLMSWYPQRNNKEVLFTTYEDMKKDTRAVVLRVAAFLGQEYVDAIEKDNNVLNNILRFSGFDYMKTHLEKVYSRPARKPEDELMRDEKVKEPDQKREKIDFMRKGIVGDWKNHFSNEQSDRMNKKFTERTQGTDIYDMYKSFMEL